MTEELDTLEHIILIQKEIRNYFKSVQELAEAQATQTTSDMLRETFATQSLKAEQKVIAVDTTLKMLTYYHKELTK